MEKQYVTSLLLASASPRRRELIKRLGVKVNFTSVDCDESVASGENYKTYVSRMSKEKLEAAVLSLEQQKLTLPHSTLVIACDTIVVYGFEILLKPKNIFEARIMLKKLSGSEHEVFTSVSWKIPNGKPTTQVKSFLTKTKVHFYKISSGLLEKYLNSKQWQDKAGSYGIQDPIASLFVKKIKGNYENVIGLPVARLNREIGEHISTNVRTNI